MKLGGCCSNNLIDFTCWSWEHEEQNNFDKSWIESHILMTADTSDERISWSDVTVQSGDTDHDQPVNIWLCGKMSRFHQISSSSAVALSAVRVEPPTPTTSSWSVKVGGGRTAVVSACRVEYPSILGHTHTLSQDIVKIFTLTIQTISPD